MKLITIHKASDFITEAFKEYTESVLDFLDVWENLYPELWSNFEYDKFFRDVGFIMQLKNKDDSELLKHGRRISELFHTLDFIIEITEENSDVIEAKGYRPRGVEQRLSDFYILLRRLDGQRLSLARQRRAREG